MSVQDSALNEEVKLITEGGPNQVHYYWECEIIANGETVKPLKVLGVDTQREYDKNFSDVIMLEIAIGAGTHTSKLYPYKDNLSVNLFKRPLKEVGGDTNYDVRPVTQNFRATLVDNGNAAVESNNPSASSEDAANLSAIISVTMQLIDPALEQIRMQTVGGIFRKTTTGDLIRTVLGSVGKTIKIDREASVKGVEMIPPSNKEVRDHIVIPHGTRLIDLPSYVHEKCGGVYNAGFGYYLQNGTWYTWPLFDISRFAKTPRTLTIINLPKNMMPSVERTFRTTPNQVVIIATGDVMYRDDSENLQLNQGNGVRFTDANQIMQGLGTTAGNKTTMKRGQNNSEFMAGSRGTGLNNVQMSDNRISANMFVETSKLARRNGVHIQLAWENSDPDLIYPGMPTQLMYLEDDVVKTIEGLVLRAHHHTALQGQGLTATRHINNTALTLFMGRKNA